MIYNKKDFLKRSILPLTSDKLMISRVIEYIANGLKDSKIFKNAFKQNAGSIKL